MNIDDITARMRKISMDTVAEVQKMNEVRSLNSQINAQKKMVQAMYTEIGKKLYDRYRAAPLDGFETDFQALDEAFDQIEDLREQIRLVKGVTLCPNCKMEVGIDERFCSNCGSKMPEVFRIVEDDEEALNDTESVTESAGAAETDTQTDSQPADTTEAQPADSSDKPEDMPVTGQEAVGNAEPQAETPEDISDSIPDELTESPAEDLQQASKVEDA